jgi:hypothetical protein
LWHLAGWLNHRREYCTASVMGDGTLLLVGGDGPDGALACAETFDLLLLRCTVADAAITPRYLHTATRLANGAVLVVGGNDRKGPLASVEMFC